MPRSHRVRQGECLSSIAKNAGFFPETIWNHAANDSLRADRADSQCLLPGDVVVIPDLRRKEDTRPSEARHRFRQKGVPEMLRVRLTVQHMPRANERYRIDIDGTIERGETDSDGWLEATIPLDARLAKVYLGTDSEPVEFQLGKLDPIEEVSGVKGRLRNLGYYFGPIDDADDAEMEGSLMDFQSAFDLKITGERDAATLAALTDACGENSE